MKPTRFVFILVIIIVIMTAGCATGTVGQINTPVPNSKGGIPAPDGQINVPAMSIQINAPGPNPLVNQATSNGKVADILLGIWHGVIAPVTLVISFIDKNWQMYEVHNDGSQYNLGFLLGVAIIFVLLGAIIGSGRR